MLLCKLYDMIYLYVKNSVERKGFCMKKITIITGVLIGSMMLTSCGILPKEEEFQEAPIVKEYEGAGYGKTSVVRGDLRETEKLTGRYKGTTTFELKAVGDQKVKKIYVKKGEKVSEGDLLVRYYSESYETKLEEAKFSIEKINLQIKQQKELMKQEIEKQKKTGGGKSGIQSVKEQYEATISSYQTQLKILNLELEDAQAGIEESDGLSEISGTVSEVTTGIVDSTPELDTTLLVIEGKKKNRFEIKSELADKYQAGDVVKIEVKGEEYEASVAKPKEKKNTLYLYPLSKNIAFSDGDKCTLICVLKERKSVLYLPSSTIFEMGDKHVVYIENEEGLKTMKEVEIGVSIDHLTEITSGLQEGEQVITD